MHERTDFEKLIESHSTLLLNKAYYLLSNKEDAEDLVQEVFYSAYTNYHHYTGKGTPLAWLTGILYNKAMDLHKKRYKDGLKVLVNFTADFDNHGEWIHTEVTNDWFNNGELEPEHLLDNDEFRKQFYGCLDSLPEKWRMVVKLCYLNGAEAKQICSELGITLSNYWKLLQRSRLQLRKCIDEKWFNV